MAGAVETWAHMRDPASAPKPRWSSEPAPPPPAFPWLYACLALPAALLSAAGAAAPLAPLWPAALLAWAAGEVGCLVAGGRARAV